MSGKTSPGVGKNPAKKASKTHGSGKQPSDLVAMKNTILFITLALANWCCSKSKQVPEPADITGTWNQTAESSGGQNLWCTYYHDICMLDDQWDFDADGTYRILDAGLACSSNSAARSGRWRLSAEGLFIDSSLFSIVGYNNKQLQVEEQQSRNGFLIHHQMGFTRP
jgi:hypothetical protein